MPRPKTLSYILNRRTNSLLKVYRKKRKAIYCMGILGGVCLPIWLYFIWNIDHFFNTWATRGTQAIPISSTDKTILLIMVLGTIFFGGAYSLWTRYTIKFKKYRDEILVILNSDPCTHTS